MMTEVIILFTVILKSGLLQRKQNVCETCMPSLWQPINHVTLIFDIMTSKAIEVILRS